jgi:uncharacterized membrane protein
MFSLSLEARNAQDLPTLVERPSDAIISDIIHGITRVVELAGVAIILVGTVASTAACIRGFRAGANRSATLRDYRTGLGRAILLGLELLVAADIINTVAIQPTLGSVAVLAGIVSIRTFLSFSLEVEIDGRWPWQRAAGAPDSREERAACSSEPR